jgi:hypothetical protein
MTKLQKTAKILDTIFNVTYRLTIVLNVLGLLAIALFLFLCLGAPELFGSITGSLVTSLDFGGISFRITDSFPCDSSYGTTYFLAGLVIGTLGITLYILMIRSIRSILAPMKEGLPFSAEVAAGFKTLGRLTILHGFLNQFATLFGTSYLARAYDLSALFVGENIASVSTYHNFDFTFVITALILFGLSYIFHYGTELQQLSDETL